LNVFHLNDLSRLYHGQRRPNKWNKASDVEYKLELLALGYLITLDQLLQVDQVLRVSINVRLWLLFSESCASIYRLIPFIMSWRLLCCLFINDVQFFEVFDLKQVLKDLFD